MIPKGASRGITHIEDLSVDDFLNTVRYISEYTITEKLDGAQLLFGLDDKGFYTSRESKGGRRIYFVDEYDITFSTTYMRSAHLLLASILSEMMSAGLQVGDQVEIEVLYGSLPNVVPYVGEINRIIFLRTTAGLADINRLSEKIHGRAFYTELEVPFTDNGKTIQLKKERLKWAFSAVPRIRIDEEAIMSSVMPLLKDMVRYLRSSSGICDQPMNVIVSLPLNKRPDWVNPTEWKDLKEQIKKKKEESTHIIRQEMMPAIKEKLLDNIVRSRASVFGPPRRSGGWIEGVVCRHRESGKMVKIVDKSTFGVIKDFAWAERNKLTESARIATHAPSFVASLNIDMASVIRHASLGTTNAKHYLKKLGTTQDELLSELTKGLETCDVSEQWLSLLDAKELVLAAALDKYKDIKDGLVVGVSMPDSGSNDILLVKYDGSIDKRTKEVFASLFEKINNLRAEIYAAKTAEDLVKVVIGKHLGNLT